MASSNELIPINKAFYVFGTIVRLTVYGTNREKALKEAVERLYEIDDKMSVFKEESEISKINNLAGIMPQKVSWETYFVIKKAVEYSKLFNGAMDITIKPLVSLWGFGAKNQKTPSSEDIQSKLKLVNYEDIILDDENKAVRLRCKNQEIDVGSIAKGYAADEIKKIFVSNNIESAIIDLGGNIYVLGSKIDGSPWRVGIQNPLKARGEYVGILTESNKSIVTSGNYERYFEEDGKKFHHIIDPRTGYPSESRVISITIISDESIEGDGLSTGAYILGVQKGIELVEAIDGIEAIFITDDKKVYMTSGIKNEFKLNGDEFECINTLTR